MWYRLLFRGNTYIPKLGPERTEQTEAAGELMSSVHRFAEVTTKHKGVRDAYPHKPRHLVYPHNDQIQS